MVEAAADAGAAVPAAAAAAHDDDEVEAAKELSYAVLHPLVVPKTIKAMEARGPLLSDGGGGGGGGKKAARRKAAAAAPAPEAPRPPATRVELRLSQLEADLKQADLLLLQGDD